ncbi:MAG TPA: tRNA-binding protein [Candidatus Thermoplasmatota archaeon]|nr:tRNA-binding protein [Candidatus Thermoplasmatota archaeon]
MTITWDDFTKVELRVGRIQKAEHFPKAKKPAYRLWIDFGPLGVKQSSAQITKRYRPEELVGRLVVGVTNFPPKQIVDFTSEVLTTGVIVQEGDVVLISPDHDVPLGARIL